jgi:nucleoid-associated protein YgaU
MESAAVCPVCQSRLDPASARCASCDEDLSGLIYIERQPDILYNEALSQAKRGAEAEAVRTLERGLAHQSAHTPSLLLLAKLYARQGHTPEARAALQSLLAVAPGYPGARETLAAIDAVPTVDVPPPAAVRRRPILPIVAASFVTGVLALLLAQFVFVGTRLPRPVVAASTTAPTNAPALTALPTTAPTSVPTAEPVPTTAPTTAPTAAPAPTTTPDVLPVVQQALLQAGITGIDVTQQGVVIFLRGTVADLEARLAAETAVRTVAGVSAVDAGGLAVAPPEIYVVRAGDTLWGIAERMYGNGARYPDIARANRLSSPYYLTIGQRLQLPRP